MGGDLVEVESSTTVVLIGKTGNGKSATANSILGRKSFISRASCSGVTTSCELQPTVLQNGRTVNVIDTPGLFDFSGETQQMAGEITKCLLLVEDGVHALILVLSVRTRFSKEEEGAVKCLREIFGEKIVDYMIIVFTGGDQLEEDEMSLEDYLNQCPDPLKELIRLCEKRVVLFNNKTKNEYEKCQQVNELFRLVDLISEMNYGKPYTHSFLAEVKEAKMKLDSLERSSKTEMNEYKNMVKDLYETQLKNITEMMEMKMNMQIELLKKQLDDEKTAREKAEQEVQNQLKAENSERVKVEIDAAKRKIEFENTLKELNERLRIAESARNKCIIM